MRRRHREPMRARGPVQTARRRSACRRRGRRRRASARSRAPSRWLAILAACGCIVAQAVRVIGSELVLEFDTEPLVQARGRPVAPGDVLLERYRIIEWIGSGSYGLVMRAYDTAHASVVAIKIRHTEVSSSRKEQGRFMREIQAIAALRSEHATRLFDYNTLPDGTPYMVMEHLDGRDLRQVIAKQGKLEP